MTTNKIYNNIVKKSYASGFGHGVVYGLMQGYDCQYIESTVQTESEERYLIIANTNLDRINTVMENYEANNKKDVLSFFNDNPSILPLVEDTYSQIHNFIPGVQKIVLDVLADPENGKKNLIATIYPQLSFDEAMYHLDLFERQWFAEKFIESEMTFNISLDFEK